MTGGFETEPHPELVPERLAGQSRQASLADNATSWQRSGGVLCGVSGTHVLALLILFRFI
jgi:hypothetical protein